MYVMVLRLIDEARPTYQNSNDWKSLSRLPITHFLIKSNYKLFLCNVLKIEAIKERKYFMYNCAWLNGNETREKNSDSLCNRPGFIQVHFRLAMKICVYQLTQSHTRGESSEPNSTQRLLQSTKKKEK